MRILAFMLLFAGAGSHAQPRGCAYQYSLNMGAEALDACAASVRPDDVDELTLLGDIFLRRSASVTDRQRAMAYYRQAAQAGSPGAEFKLAKALKSDGAPTESWIGIFEKAAAAGDGEAIDVLTNLDWRISESQDPKDRMTSQLYFQALLRLAGQGRLNNERYAQIGSRIGYMYDKGQGTPVNRAEAAAWYAKAGERGGYKALWTAAKMYQLGDGVPPDAKRAEQLSELFFETQKEFWIANPSVYVRWLSDFADLGFKRPALRLAEIYENGTHGVTADATVAARYRAQSQGVSGRTPIR